MMCLGGVIHLELGEVVVGGVMMEVKGEGEVQGYQRGVMGDTEMAEDGWVVQVTRIRKRLRELPVLRYE